MNRPDPVTLASCRRALETVLPPGRVSAEPALLEKYSHDITESPPSSPDLVVRPTTTEEVQALVRVAGEHGVPITPVVASTNVGGLAIPAAGGIVCDLTGMNRIVEVNPEDLYMVLEPGVSAGDVRRHLDAHHPTLRMGYSLGPPEASVVANCLLDGLVNLSLLHGPMSEWVNGLEAVLPTGEILRTGSAALGASWCTNSPLPDLTGLFLNFQGTTGIVTKLAVQVWPKPPLRRRLFLLARDLESPFALLRRMARTGLFDDLGALSWPVGKMLFGEARPEGRDPAEPALFLYVDLSGHFPREFRAKEEVLEGIVREEARAGRPLEGPLDVDRLVRVEPRFRQFADLPTRLTFFLDHPGGGLTWVGTYGPTSRWEEGARRGCALMEKFGLPPTMVARPMRGAHFGVLRFISLFDRADAEEVRRVRALNVELLEALLDLGFIPYKTPPWAARQMAPRLDPVFLAVLRRIKGTLDPRGILNPGKWFLE